MLHLYLSGEVTVNGVIHGNHNKSQLFNSFSFKIWHLMTHMLLRQPLSKHMKLMLFLLIWMFKRCSNPSICQPAIWFHMSLGSTHLGHVVLCLCFSLCLFSVSLCFCSGCVFSFSLSVTLSCDELLCCFPLCKLSILFLIHM